jgi:hypothetical protein
MSLYGNGFHGTSPFSLNEGYAKLHQATVYHHVKLTVWNYDIVQIEWLCSNNL